MEAVQIAESLETSKGYALASKSQRIHARYIAKEQDRQMLHAYAIELAKKAIESDSNNAGAYLELASAIGRHSYTISKAKALSDNYAQKTREAIETAIRIDPDLPSAHISLGRWHVGIIARMGSFLARTTFGAKKKVAISSFERAIELNLQSKADYFSIAIGYLELHRKKYRDMARKLLQRAIDLPVKSAYGRIIHMKAVEHLKMMGTDG